MRLLLFHLKLKNLNSSYDVHKIYILKFWWIMPFIIFTGAKFSISSGWTCSAMACSENLQQIGVSVHSDISRGCVTLLHLEDGFLGKLRKKTQFFLTPCIFNIRRGICCSLSCSCRQLWQHHPKIQPNDEHKGW